jgi:hypothetical protein
MLATNAAHTPIIATIIAIPISFRGEGSSVFTLLFAMCDFAAGGKIARVLLLTSASVLGRCVKLLRLSCRWLLASVRGQHALTLYTVRGSGAPSFPA